MQKEIAKRLIEIKDIVNFLNDGLHREDVENLRKIHDDLYLRLTPTNKKKYENWLMKKIKGV